MKPDSKKSPSVASQKILFIASVGLVVLLHIFYVFNMVHWRTAPEFGWLPVHGLGPQIVGVTTPLGEEAGLRHMDRILELNGKSFETYDELNELTNFEIGSINEYRIERNHEIVTLRVTTAEIGAQRVIMLSGFYWVIGIFFLGIGILVFLMKPYHGPSWVFFLMTMILSLVMPYYIPSGFYKPSWLENISIFSLPVLPASIMHLAALFPVKKTYLTEKKWLVMLPYLGSFMLAVASRAYAPRIAMIPFFLLQIIYFYLFASCVFFLILTITSYKRALSIAVRQQSLVIFAGVTIALFVPVVDMVFNLVFKVPLFPSSYYVYVFFLVFFPLSIGYAIVRHDLFEIDVIVRRTYGYILSTAAVIGVYALIVSALNLATQTAEFSRSPLFSIAFALGVVFFFRPLHERLQGFVDRVFYRQKYDYRKTIKDISEAMTSILDSGQIHRTLIGSVVKEMFLENGLLLLHDPGRKAYHVPFVEGNKTDTLSSKELTDDDLLVQVIVEKNDFVFRSEVELHPRYEAHRETLLQRFQSFASELMIPMKYKDEMRGIISLGGKKSGRMFTPEDLDLLKTLINQSVIALENAELFEENLEKGRMEEELKIAHDIQVSMLPEKAPAIEGFTIAAKSLPAREVGGDFYDFIETSDAHHQRLGIVVGDVSGKAVSGALVMAASRSIFRVLAESDISVREMMSIGNARLNSDVKKGMFVALLYGVIDPQKKTLTLSNAGQTQPVYCSVESVNADYIETPGDRFPLGVIKDCDYQETSVQLRQGDTLVFYTDGIVEAMNDKKEIYGFDRFLNAITAGRHLGADALLEKLMDDVDHFVDGVEQHDDLTMVVVKVE
jgi:serine phosphatase RsbU (regulator of sigma subunit)